MALRLILPGLLTGFLFATTAPILAADETMAPVTPDASPEARALLQLLYDISGKYTLTGQHNFPNTKDDSTQQAARWCGKTPAVYSQDWGFARDGDKDSYLARPAIVEEVKRQHQLGSIITICWHAVPPTADEPVVFRQRRGAETPQKLASVQGQLTDEQFRDVLTPGTPLHQHWCDQVDTIAGHLKQLREARVPVLWRPYHEMNGDWFWWGGRLEGQYTTAALYRQLYDRYTKVHKLNNLIWVWSVDRPEGATRQFVDYFPGSEYYDVASLDCYGEFKPSYYDQLLELAKGKPLVLGEVGRAPAREVIAQQPKWSLYVIWAGMVRMTPQERLEALVNDPRLLSLEDPAYREAVTSMRAASGLEPLGPVAQRPQIVRQESSRSRQATPEAEASADPSGTWTWERTFGDNTMRYKLRLVSKDDQLTGTYETRRGAGSQEAPAPVAISSAKWQDKRLSFTVSREFNGQPITLNYSGTVSNNRVTGTTKVDFQGNEREFDWDAQRVLEPEDVLGTWQLTVESPSGDTFESTLKITQDGDALTGVHTSQFFGQRPLKNVKIENLELSYQITYERDGNEMTFTHAVQPRGNKLTGVIKSSFGGQSREIPVRGTRSAESTTTD